MLKQIIAKFLNLPEDEAAAVIEILRVEGYMTQKFKLNNQNKNSFKAAYIETQANFIHFLHLIAQSKWAVERVYSGIADRLVEKRERYFKLFKEAGLMSAHVAEGPPLGSEPEGSSESVEARDL